MGKKKKTEKLMMIMIQQLIIMQIIMRNCLKLGDISQYWAAI